jgi:hypothetical protein
MPCRWLFTTRGRNLTMEILVQLLLSCPAMVVRRFGGGDVMVWWWLRGGPLAAPLYLMGQNSLTAA